MLVLVQTEAPIGWVVFAWVVFAYPLMACTLRVMANVVGLCNKIPPEVVTNLSHYWSGLNLDYRFAKTRTLSGLLPSKGLDSARLC